jgi:transcriptional regulator of acetoin/glycerol metabolism
VEKKKILITAVDPLVAESLSVLLASPGCHARVETDLDGERRISSHFRPDGRTVMPLKKALEGPEKEIIAATLASVNWNRQKAARLLDINRATLFNKMRKYGLLEIKRGGVRK